MPCNMQSWNHRTQVYAYDLHAYNYTNELFIYFSICSFFSSFSRCPYVRRRCVHLRSNAQQLLLLLLLLLLLRRRRAPRTGRSSCQTRAAALSRSSPLRLSPRFSTPSPGSSCSAPTRRAYTRGRCRTARSTLSLRTPLLPHPHPHPHLRLRRRRRPTLRSRRLAVLLLLLHLPLVVLVVVVLLLVRSRSRRSRRPQSRHAGCMRMLPVRKQTLPIRITLCEYSVSCSCSVHLAADINFTRTLVVYDTVRY